MKKRDKLLIFAILVFGILINGVNAEIKISNESSIDTSYGPSQLISGFINLSVKNESANLLLLYSNQSITLKDFLDRNSITYSCFPIDCSNAYTKNGTETDSKSVYIKEGYSKIIGIKLTGTIDSITSFVLNVSTDSQKSCVYPLKLDILNDELYDWKANGVSNEQCYIEKPYGCFNGNSVTKSTKILSDAIYCEKTRVPPVKWFKLGAKITGNGDAGFKMSIKTGGSEKECPEVVIANQSGEISCIVGLDEELTQFTDAEICMKSDGNSNPEYNISYEDNQPCGYSQVGSNRQSLHDFEVFVYPLKYNSVNNFKIDNDLFEEGFVIESRLSEYINNKYKGNCTPECIIPIKITSGINQNVKISNMKMDYVSQSLSNSKTVFYEVLETSPTINFDYKKLNIEKAGFLTSSDYSVREVLIMLGSKEILRQNISVKKVPKIYDLLHTPASTLIPTTFFVYMENISSLNVSIRFEWDFGDGDKQTTTTKTAKHTYSKIGTYDVSVKAIKEGVGDSSKTVKVSVVPPKEGIGVLLKQDREDLRNISSTISGLPEWIKAEIKKKIDIDDMDLKLKVQEEEYKGAIGEEYTQVMQDVLNIKIPYSLRVSQNIDNMMFIPNPNQFNLKKLEDVQGTSLADSDSEDIVAKYFSANNNWISKNIVINFESKTYTVYYSDGNDEDLLSYLKVTFAPKETIQDLYLVINGDPNKIKFNDEMNLKTKQLGEDSMSVTFTDMGLENKEVEFLYPGKISAAGLPFFVSPDLKEIEIVSDIGICNNNKICDSGEDSKNCRSDCKPWGLTLIFLIILLIVALVLYLVLQEWYKRRYEAYLFKDKNQLFNLINYMNNAVHQGQTKAQVFSSLKNYKWTNEQMEFAWRKLNGERTGMWEIPIFKWIDNKEVKKELDKRKIISPVGLGRNPENFRPRGPQPRR